VSDGDEEQVDVAYTGDGEDQMDPEAPTASEESAEPGDPVESEEPDETAGIGGDVESMEPDEILEGPGDADDPFAELAAEMREDAAVDGEEVTIGGEASDAASPFDELDADVDDVDPDELFEEMFVEQEAGGIDAESVWDALEESDEEPEEADAEGDEHVVSAREFCAQCEHAAEPPEIRCTYEGSEIVEFADKNTVRVRNCPIVARRNQLGDME